tara:strand:- start:58 stop:555 length:498 start_codon:yes stop_codon:yes gene_type:complete
MEEFLPNLLLVLCGIVAVIALVIAYVWYFIFGRSLRAILMAGLSIMMNRDSTIDLDADVVVEKRPEQAKKEITQEVDALDFQGSLTSHDKYIPQIDADESLNFGAQTADAQPQKQDFVSTSFGTGRFHRVTEIFSRPFLKMRINPKSDDVPAQNIKHGTDPSNNQ